MTANAIYQYVPHRRTQGKLEGTAPGPVRVSEQLPSGTAAQRFNARLAVKVTSGVGTMWCAYAFGALALVSLPSAISSGSPIILVSWISQTFLQLVLLSVIIVGQNVLAAAADKRSEATFKNACSPRTACSPTWPAGSRGLRRVRSPEELPRAAARLDACRCASAYATWNDLLARPSQYPVIVVTGAGPAPAPSDTNSGAKCSVVGCAYLAPGACLNPASASTSPRSSASPAHRSNSVDQPGGGASNRKSRRNGSPWVRKPLPMISTPSSRNGRSAAPIRSSRPGSSVGIETWRTGMSAAGYITVSGTYAP